MCLRADGTFQRSSPIGNTLSASISEPGDQCVKGSESADTKTTIESSASTSTNPNRDDDRLESGPAGKDRQDKDQPDEAKPGHPGIAKDGRFLVTDSDPAARTYEEAMARLQSQLTPERIPPPDAQDVKPVPGAPAYLMVKSSSTEAFEFDNRQVKSSTMFPRRACVSFP